VGIADGIDLSEAEVEVVAPGVAVLGAGAKRREEDEAHQ
jgi:hypothetical protein